MIYKSESEYVRCNHRCKDKNCSHKNYHIDSRYCENRICLITGKRVECLSKEVLNPIKSKEGANWLKRLLKNISESGYWVIPRSDSISIFKIDKKCKTFTLICGEEKEIIIHEKWTKLIGWSIVRDINSLVMDSPF